MDNGLWIMVECLRSGFVRVVSQVFVCRGIRFDLGRLW